MVDLEVPVEGAALGALDTFLSSDQSLPEHDAVRCRWFSDRDSERTQAGHAE
jgi:hypothetical protein